MIGSIEPTTSSLFRRSVEHFPDREALVVGPTRFTFAMLGNIVAGLARSLREAGATGTRVAMVMGNTASTVAAYYAIWEAGATAVPLNPEYTERELSEILQDAEAHMLVCGIAQEGRARALAVQLTKRESLVLDDPDLAGLLTSTTVDQSLPDPKLPAILQYTGGTTGRSKGVILTHASVATNILQRDRRIPMRPGEERILCVTPLFHAYATAMALFPALSHGGALVVLPRFKPEAVFDTIERERITLFAGAPAIYNALVVHPEFETRNLATLSASFSGSAPLAVDVLERWQAVSGAPILEGYGLTEASPILTFNPRHGVRKPGSVGPAVEGTQIEIVDPVTGEGPLGTGVIGEVRARGPQLMVGYRGRDQETADAIRDGWLYTGDLGELDDDGYLFIRGRKKDMVIVGGFNVYPREIEEVLFSLSGVEDCCAVGVRDSYRGEVVHAYVVRCAGSIVTEQEVIDHCARNLVRYKVPAKVEFIDVLPRTTVGKLDRVALRKLADSRIQNGGAA